ncbi:hypothetical protein CHS0354_001616 [Potamilus streckersoni]|uniref:Uncharacterized protein n=1 Tax=Potamilus streckersoni TaxID=2493646 RepID=A0AAE0SET7_9BIVA|nr:hypothetical protein CHS0354_001616 [Potamilus streckersoni]
MSSDIHLILLTLKPSQIIHLILLTLKPRHIIGLLASVAWCEPFHLLSVIAKPRNHVMDHIVLSSVNFSVKLRKGSINCKVKDVACYCYIHVLCVCVCVCVCVLR